MARSATNGVTASARVLMGFLSERRGHWFDNAPGSPTESVDWTGGPRGHFGDALPLDVTLSKRYLLTYR